MNGHSLSPSHQNAREGCSERRLPSTPLAASAIRSLAEHRGGVWLADPVFLAAAVRLGSTRQPYID